MKTSAKNGVIVFQIHCIQIKERGVRSIRVAINKIEIKDSISKDSIFVFLFLKWETEMMIQSNQKMKKEK